MLIVLQMQAPNLSIHFYCCEAQTLAICWICWRAEYSAVRRGGRCSSQGFQLTLKLRQEALRWDWASGPGNQMADVLGWHARWASVQPSPLAGCSWEKVPLRKLLLSVCPPVTEGGGITPEGAAFWGIWAYGGQSTCSGKAGYLLPMKITGCQIVHGLPGFRGKDRLRDLNWANQLASLLPSLSLSPLSICSFISIKFSLSRPHFLHCYQKLSAGSFSFPSLLLADSICHRLCFRRRIWNLFYSKHCAISQKSRKCLTPQCILRVSCKVEKIVQCSSSSSLASEVSRKKKRLNVHMKCRVSKLISVHSCN